MRWSGGGEGGVDVKVRLLSCFCWAQVFGTPWLVLRWLPSRVISCFGAMPMSNVMLGVGGGGWGRTLMSILFSGRTFHYFGSM